MTHSNVVTTDFRPRSMPDGQPKPVPARKPRDPRLDFYRGIAMIIILISHTPNNFWANYIPARFGFSDATEIFVFCSGMASAIAFGSSFVNRGWWLGTARVLYRMWQVYWGHIGLFLVLATMLAMIDASGVSETVYIGTLNLWKVFEDPAPELIGLMTLTYVPNYFDVLPMYIAILGMMPVAMILARTSPWLVAIVCAAVWLAAQDALLSWLGISETGLSFPAEPWSEREWFFNPFGWQLVFFTGFAFMRGWIPAPPVHWALVALAVAVVLVCVPFSVFAWRIDFAPGEAFQRDHADWVDKTDFGPLRYLHFLALAYVAWVAAGVRGARLRPEGEGLGARIWRHVVAIVMRVGQQSLAVFLFSMVFAQFSGFVMDQTGRTAIIVSLANVVGIAALVAVAYLVGWFKSQPWRAQAPR
ncbi:OpgC family protein [Oceaniglobus roseus]|uniref:OpgC family protein n=1 Tax=Oceaniglobus roseus TaxID=1737570 RepID=UPI000C7EA96C|nr:OpgC domain-containing protein [Kandeliimicrobium roseum]